ncbi:MAG: hypothetical protein JWM27_1679 [Gemmatimonadetes bacterium]|nr:hypothetical protein [Gemmatimonadota bacterium]
MQAGPSRWIVPVLALCLPFTSATLRAQGGGSPDDFTAPTVQIGPQSGTVFTTATASFQVFWSDDRQLAPGTAHIYLNGTEVTSSFTYSGSATSATSSGTLSLQLGANTLRASIADVTGNESLEVESVYNRYIVGVTVTPDGTARTGTGGGSLTQAFTVTNTGNVEVDYATTLTCTAPLTACTAPATVHLLEAQSATVTATLGTGAPTASGTGRATLRAAYTGNTSIADTGWVTVAVSPAPTYTVSVTPDGATAGAYTGAAELTQAFTVTNTGTALAGYRFTVACTGAVLACTTPQTVTLGAGSSTTVSVGYAATASAGSGHVQLTATSTSDPTVSDAGSLDVAVSARAAYAVNVTPDAAILSAAPSAAASQVFTVTNTGTTSATYNLAASCTGTAIASVCSVPASVTVAPNASATATVSFTTSSAVGSGRVRLLATSTADPAAADSGWVGVGVVTRARAAPVVDVLGVNANGTLDRGSCFTAAAAPGLMYQCGAFVLGHAMPSVRSLGKGRAPALVYNTETAHPWPIVSADVTLPAGAAKPDSVTAVLSVNGATYAASLPSVPLNPGTTRRAGVSFDGIALATGLYPYTLEVRNWYGTTFYAAQAGGQLAIVNTAGSKLGAGWSVAGLARLVTTADGRRLWVDGDGSTTVFQTVTAGSRWRADALEADGDSLVLSGGLYVRYLKGGARIVLNGDGRETAIVSRLGVETSFVYDPSSGNLTTIRTAHAQGGVWDPQLSYAFEYNGAGGILSRVRAPGLTAATTRDVVFGTDGLNHLTTITDPDGAVRQIQYDGPLTHLASVLVDERGSRIALGYTNPARTAWSATRYGGGSVSNAQNVTVTYVDPRVWPLQYGIIDPAAWPGVYDGPRTDSVDVARVWLDRLGQVARIRDPHFTETYLTRGDPRFPALVTKVDAPAAGAPVTGSVAGVGPRRVSLAYYNSRGGMDSTVVVNPLGPNADGSARNARTTVLYGDPRWPDFPTQTTSPTGLVSLTGYDATGNRVWQQAGPDPARRSFFHSNALGQVDTVWSARAAAAGEAPETIEYDATLRNVSAVVSPLGIRTTYQGDRIGRDTLTVAPVDTATDASGATSIAYQRQITRYDVVDRVWQTVSTGPKIKFPSFVAVNASAWDSVPAEAVTVTNTYVHDLLTAVARVASPDPGGVGTVTTGYHYDALARKTVEVAPDGGTDSTVYDLAGNVVQTWSRRGKMVSMTYDALGRLLHRTVPPDTAVTPPVYAGLDTWYFPRYVDDGSGGLDSKNSLASLIVPGEEADFAYDGAGHIVRADNGDAQVRRTYYPNGQLRTDTLHIRTYRGTDFATHTYALTYAYDLEGRQTVLQLPVAIAPAAGFATQSYGYNPVTGALETITDPLANTFQFGYDDDQRLTGFWRNGFSEQYGYDPDGRRTHRLESKTNTTAYLHDDAYGFDLRGKQRFVRSLADSTRVGYSGLGSLARSFTGARSNSGTSVNERYEQDALGNQVQSVTKTTGATRFQYEGTPPSSLRRYQAGTGRLRGSTQHEISSSSYFLPVGQDSSLYDASGNRWLFTQYHQEKTPYPTTSCARWAGCSTVDGSTAVFEEATRQYYGADERLRVVDRRTCFQWNGHCDTVKQPLPSQRGAFEEYRYDALGRRVLVRTRQSWLCQSRCMNVVRRVIWDGDNVLAEIQAPGQDSATAAVMEQDVGFSVRAGNAYVGPDTSGTSAASASMAYPGFYLGRVVYVHGGGMDHPLAILRMEYSDSLPGPITIFPHENWKGSFDLGSYTGGTLNPPCKLLHSGGTYTQLQTFTPELGNEAKPTATDTTSHCLSVNWPAPHEYLTHQTQDKGFLGLEGWNGSLVDGMRDASGQMYMRNRYYDPQSSRFTQEDPIGIAGGLNVYGFAKGDPVSYSDPYGLAAEDCCQALKEMWTSWSDWINSGHVLRDLHGAFRDVAIPAWTAPGAGMAVRGMAEGAAAGVMHAGGDRTTPPTPGSPEISPRSVAGKTPNEIHEYAKSRGLLPQGPDPANGRGAYTDPVTGKQRVLSHPNSCSPHCHVNNPAGERLDVHGSVVAQESPAAHLPIGGKPPTR